MVLRLHFLAAAKAESGQAKAEKGEAGGFRYRIAIRDHCLIIDVVKGGRVQVHREDIYPRNLADAR